MPLPRLETTPPVTKTYRGLSREVDGPWLGSLLADSWEKTGPSMTGCHSSTDPDGPRYLPARANSSAAAFFPVSLSG